MFEVLSFFVVLFFCWLFCHLVADSRQKQLNNQITKPPNNELSKHDARINQTGPENGKNAFFVFHGAKIRHRERQLWVSVGFVAKKLGKSGFVGFRWVSAFIIYIYIYYICMRNAALRDVFSQITNHNTQRVTPSGGGYKVLRL